jgi:hypothetical protein
MQDDTHSYILQDQVRHLKHQVEYWQKKYEDLEEEIKHNNWERDLAN